jgi:SOS-response transcriptional repressor LexA
MLTKRQMELLQFIGRHLRQSGGVGPTYSEMAEAMGLNSKSSLQAMIERMERDGYIRRLRGRARALEMTTIFVFDDVTKELKPMPAKEATQTVDRAA